MTESDAVVGGRYKIIEQLGEGSYGKTFLAQDLHLPGTPECVVKKFSPQNRNHRNVEMGLRLFNKEAETLYRLGKHAQIPHLLAHFLNEDDYEYYLVQEFVEGQDLTEEIENGLEESQVVQLLIDILEILKYVHDENVIHRDLKPSNIRRRLDEKIVLLDFGAVKEVSVIDGEQASSTVAIGTRGYCSSEQATGRPRFNSDIYAVGMLAIQAITKNHPKNLEEDPLTGEIIWRNLASVSNDLAEILDKMIRYHFSQRYQSVGEVLDALNSLQNSAYVDVVATAREVLEKLKNDIRMKSGGIVLPQVRQFMVEHIENFNNLYVEYTRSLVDKRLSTFLQTVCQGTDFGVEPDHPAKLVVRDSASIQEDIHSEESYRQILMSGHRKFKLSSPKTMIQVARQVVKKPIREEDFALAVKIISEDLPSLEHYTIRNSLLAFWSAGCFETEPDFGLPWERRWTLKPSFESEEELLEALRDGVRDRLQEALLDIDEEIDENVLGRMLP